MKSGSETEGRFACGKVPARRRVAGLRLWLFRIIAATIIPVLLLILAELCLRITGFGYPTSAVITHEIAGRQVCINNLKFGWQFFPKKIAREMRAFIFPPVKPTKTYRIFVLGGSAALGAPEPSYGFSRILNVLLDNEYRDLKFEVINVGIPAMNSHGVLEIAKDCARYEPDLFVVYLGNNEVTGPYGAGTVFTPLSPSLSSIRAGIAAKSLKLGQLLEGLLNSLAPSAKQTARWKGLQMFLDKQVRFGSPELQNVYKHFESNLTDICNLGRKAGARVIVCNVATNLKDCPPFASLHKPGFKQTDETTWNKIYNLAVRLESDGKYDEALLYYMSTLGVDEQFAEIYFRMARCYWVMGKYDQARDSYIRARNLDTLRFRAERQINEIIHRVANRAGEEVSFVDIVKACQKASPHNTPGKELFLEHVHFNFKGNYLLACTLLEQVEKLVLEQRSVKKAADSLMLSEEDCATRLAFTGWNRQEILKRTLDGYIKHPPFTNQAYHDEHLREMEQQIEALNHHTQPPGLKEAVSQYQQALKWNPSDWHLRWKYGQFLHKVCDEDEAAVSQLAMVLQEIPHCYVYNELSVLFYKQDKIDEGLNMARRALEMKPLAAWSHFNLALGLDKKGQLKRAIKHYSKALEIDHKMSIDAYRLLATALHNNGSNNEAIEVLREGTNIFPHSADLHYELGVSLERLGNISKAVKAFRVALSARPDYLSAREALSALERKINQQHALP